MVNKKEEVVIRELDKNTKILVDNIEKMDKGILSDKTIAFQKQMSIRSLLKIYEPMLNQYLQDEDMSYQKGIKEGFDKKSKHLVASAKTGEHKEFYKEFYKHLMQVITTRKCTMEEIEKLWK